jgi:DNA-binding HxlR family transcriptional regulator
MLDGFHKPPLPSGMSERELADALHMLQNDGIVTHTAKPTPGGCEYTWEIAPGMSSIIEELLYE